MDIFTLNLAITPFPQNGFLFSTLHISHLNHWFSLCRRTQIQVLYFKYLRLTAIIVHLHPEHEIHWPGFGYMHMWRLLQRSPRASQGSTTPSWRDFPAFPIFPGTVYISSWFKIVFLVDCLVDIMPSVSNISSSFLVLFFLLFWQFAFGQNTSFDIFQFVDPFIGTIEGGNFEDVS